MALKSCNIVLLSHSVRMFNTRKKKGYIISFCEFVPLNILVLHSQNDSGLYTNPLFMHIVRYIV